MSTLTGHSIMNAAHHGVQRSPMLLTGDTPQHQAQNQYFQYHQMQLLSNTLQSPYSACELNIFK